MALLVPIQDVPSQTFNVQLASQPFTLTIAQKSTGLYMDILLNGAVVLAGVICEDRNRLVRDAYFGIVGDFAFMDTQGTEDPSLGGLGSRWLLIYLEAADLSGISS